MVSNAFKMSHDGTDWRDATLLCATACGVVALAISFVVAPFGRAFVATSWALVLVGIVLGLCPRPLRWWGTGLIAAGLSLPVAAFCYLWVAVSVGVLA